MSCVNRKGTGERIFTVFNYIFLGMLSVIFAYPMVHSVFASISDPLQLMSHSGVIYKPLGFSLEGYKVVLANPNITTGYVNTITYTVIGTALSMLMTILGAYALSRKRFPGKKFFTFAIVFTMYFSGGMIPSFLLVKGIGLYNTRAAMILPTLLTTWNLIVMKTSFQAVPASLEESAKVDGANDFIILFRIILPVTIPTLAVMTLFYAVGYWNSWFSALMYIRDRGYYPLQMFLREILIANSASGNASLEVDTYSLEQSIKFTTIIVSTVPILFIYPFVQRYFMSGLMLGSVKE